MYLELSPRRTGKTHRLLNEILRCINQDQDIKILMFLQDSYMYEYFLDLLKANNIDKNRFIFILNENTFISHALSYIYDKEKSQKIILAVDEFLYCRLFLNKYEEICKNNIELINNGIFVSTYGDLSYISMDLINKNGWYYTVNRNINV